METLFEMKKRHQREKLALILAALRTCSSVSEAAKLIKIDRGALYRELRQAGVFPKYQRLTE